MTCDLDPLGEVIVPGLKNAFCVMDGGGGGKTQLFQCRSADDRDRWLEAFANERRMSRSQENLDLDGLRRAISSTSGQDESNLLIIIEMMLLSLQH